MVHLFSLSGEDRNWAVARLAELATPTPAFYALTALSTLIASFGLLSNSTAVVIGAMLIAPLMGPIFGLTMGLVRGDGLVLRRAVIAETSGVACSIALGLLVGLLPLHPQFGSEVLGRTSPNLLDLAVALGSGLVGAYCMVNRRLSETIAGVAIATAVVPPLATCGLCLAAGMYGRAAGAFLLFGTNFIAIQFAATVVFLLAGLEEERAAAGRPLARMARMLGPGLVLLTVLGVSLTRTLATFVERQALESQMRAEIVARLGSRLGAQLEDLHFSGGDVELEVVASVLTPVEISPRQVEELERKLEESTGRQLHLIIRAMSARDLDREGTVYANSEERQRAESSLAEAGQLEIASAILRLQLSQYPGAELMSLERGADGRFSAAVQTPAEIGPARVAQLEAALTAQLGDRTRLVVRSILTRDADAERYIYEPDTSPALTPDAVFRQAKLETILRSELAERSGSAELVELRQRAGPPLMVIATLRAPASLGPGEVEALQERLIKRLGQPLRLVLHTQVESWADAQAYLRADEALSAPPGDGASPGPAGSSAGPRAK